MKLSSTILLIFIINFANAQLHLQSLPITNMPEPLTNTACAIGKHNNATSLYCFGGIDSSLLYSGIHQKCFGYDSASQVWRTLPNLPDTLGKIASSATNIKDTIYIVGGYHVYANGNEKSSNRVHRFVPAIDSFITDATPIPIAIDDQAQAVWRDSLLYVISGWNNTASVPNVQIFNPANNSWQVGTSVPNNNFYKCFGSNATIIGDTIFYFGGASAGANFPNTNYLRKGIIDANNPMQITWSYVALPTQFRYRGVVTRIKTFLILAGGSKKTYNYNGFAYDGSGVVKPTNSYYIYDTQSGATVYDSTMQIINMDSRTVAGNELNSFYLLGGIDANGKVSAISKKYFLSIGNTISTNNKNEIQFDIFPNPTLNNFNISTNIEFSKIMILDINGKICKQFIKQHKNKYEIGDLKSGNYFCQLQTKRGWVSKLLVKE
jgi:hypothetical protein